MNLNNASAQGFRAGFCAGNGHCERGGSEGERQFLRTEKHRQHRHKENDGVGVFNAARKGRGECAVEGQLIQFSCVVFQRMKDAKNINR